MKKFYGILIILFFAQFSIAQKVTVPVLSAPANEYAYCMPDVTLDWYPSSGIGEISYQVQLATDENFSNLVVDESNLAASAHFNENLLFGQQYFWRVKSKDDLGESNWSTVYTFTVFSVCTLDKPKDGDKKVANRPLMKWKKIIDANDISGVDSFDIEIDTSANFDSPQYAMYNSDSMRFQMAADYLLFNATYYWHLRPVHVEGHGEWTETWSFETVVGVEAISPSNNSTNQEFDLELKWKKLEKQDDDLYEYTCQISTDESFSDPISLITTELKVQPDFLKFTTEYFWRVRAAHPNDTCEWTETRSFTMIDKVTLDSPSDNEDVTTLRPTLSWEAIAGVDSYQIQLSKNPDLSDAQLINIPDGDENSYPLPELDKTNYYWSVRAHRLSDFCEWADTYTFNTLHVGLEEMDNVSNLNIYPNPATTSLSVEFFAQNNMELKVSIKNIIGETIIEEVKTVNSGLFKSTFNVSSLKSGIYFLELNQENQRTAIKFIVK